MLDAWPVENGRADILQSDMAGGGSACNLAIDIRKLDPDLSVATQGIVGEDPEGRFLLELADSFTIERSGMHSTDRVVTDYTFAFCTVATGQRTHISYFGSSHELSPDHFDFSESNHKIFHLGLPGVHRIMDNPWQGHANGWVATLIKAREAGLITNLELASIDGERLKALVRPCLPHLDFLIVNDAEIGGIAGIDTVTDGKTDTRACIAAAEKALNEGVSRIVAVHFPAGAVAVSREGAVVTMPSVKVPRDAVAGANGAGDAFAAGFVYAVHQDWGLERAVAAGPRDGGGLLTRDIDDRVGRVVVGLSGPGGALGAGGRRLTDTVLSDFTV